MSWKKILLAIPFMLLIIILFSSQVRVWFAESSAGKALFDSAPPTEIEGPFLSDEARAFPLDPASAVTLSDFEGQVIMISYWASWCHTCRQTIPTIQTLARDFEHRDDIVFLFLSLDNVPESASRFLDGARIQIPNFFPANALPSPLHRASVPTTYVIDKNGRIVYRNTGYTNYSTPSFRQWFQSVADRPV
ncbi:MAG: TlpA family protein disulfide reductase [Balneolales bacterium]|nr:TlpA family protein disulfide reductase [Balneolales bacterium]